ncbi:MAG: hypothetical protein IT318_00360, partial [Anaerolineales bacterium]|nr:hypothetical protein [Anaerolineales bacterium]
RRTNARAVWPSGRLRARWHARAAEWAPLADPPAGQVWRSDYYAGGQRVAVRVQGDPAPALRLASDEGIAHCATACSTAWPKLGSR